MILALRTDKADAELYLLDQEGNIVAKHDWQAHRQLADTILPTIEDFLKKNNKKFTDLNGLIIFTGEGSFTGLRIGTTVANTLAYSLGIAIVKADGQDWLKSGFKLLQTAEPGNFVTPDYSGEPNITKPKK